MVMPAMPPVQFGRRPWRGPGDDDENGDGDGETVANAVNGGAGEDKMERERRRLLDRRSAPNGDGDGDEAGPSAPVLLEMGREDRAGAEEEQAFGFRAAEAESGLPRYERLG